MSNLNRGENTQTKVNSAIAQFSPQEKKVLLAALLASMGVMGIKKRNGPTHNMFDFQDEHGKNIHTVPLPKVIKP